MVPNLPGLIGSINTSIPVGGAAHLYDFAWIYGVRQYVFQLAWFSFSILQFTSASFVFYVTSTLFPAKETYMDEAILGNTLPSSRPDSVDSKSLAGEKNMESKGEIDVEVCHV